MKIKNVIIFILANLFIVGCCHNSLKNYSYKHPQINREIFKEYFKVVIDSSVIYCPNDKTSSCILDEYTSTGSGIFYKSYADENLHLVGSYFLTAGHICNEKKMILKSRIFEKNDLSIKEDDGLIYLRNFSLVGKGEEIYSSLTQKIDIVAVDDDNDICLIWIDKVYKRGVPLSKESPKIGDFSFSISSPFGLGGDYFVIFDGYFGGVIEEVNSNFYSIHSDSGSSGGPIFNVKSELIGIIHSTSPDINSITLTSKFSSLKEFLEKEIQNDLNRRENEISLEEE